MNKKQLAERLAKQSHRSRGEAADTVDKLVYGIIRDLRATQQATAKKNSQATEKPSAPNPPSKSQKGQS